MLGKKIGLRITLGILILCCFVLPVALGSIFIAPNIISISGKNINQTFKIPTYSDNSSVNVNWQCSFRNGSKDCYFKITDSHGTIHVNNASSNSSNFVAIRGETYTINAYGGWHYEDDGDYGYYRAYDTVTVGISYSINCSYNPYQTGEPNITIPFNFSYSNKSGFSRRIVIPEDSGDNLVTVYWQCNLKYIYNYPEDPGYFKISDNQGNIIENRTTKTNHSGSFLAKRGETYTIIADGGSRYDYYDEDYDYGSVSGNINYNIRYDCTFNSEVSEPNKTVINNSININCQTSFNQSFTIPTNSYDPLIKVIWQYNLREIEDDGYFKITDSKGRTIIYSNGANDQLGTFWAERGETYTVKAYGGMYDNGDYDYDYGTVSGKVAYNIRYNNLFYRIVNVDSQSCRKDHRYIYFPTNISTGTHVCEYYPAYINSSSNLITKPYTVWIKYIYHLDNPDEDGNDSSPYLSISRVDAGGNIIPGTTITKWIGQGQTIIGYIDVNPNEGLLFDYYMGDWYYYGGFERNHRSYTGYVEVAYQFDDKSPETPELPRILNGTEVGGEYYVKPCIKNGVFGVIIEWDAVQDRGPLLDDNEDYETKSGISHYNLYIDDVQVLSGITDNNIFINFNNFNQGSTHRIKIQAVDNDNNVSDFSPVTKIVVDNTPPSNPYNLTTFSINNCTKADPVIWTWDRAIDTISGVKQYHIIIKDKETGVTFKEGVIIVEGNLASAENISYSCPGLLDQKTYECAVIAEDYAGNLSEPASNNVKIIRSVPQVTLPSYSINSDGGNLSLTWNSGSDVDHYEVGITENTEPPLTYQTVYGNTHTLGNYSSRKTWYLWVRAVDVLGNRSPWTMAGPFPGFTLTGPIDGLVTNKTSHIVTITPRNGQELKYKAKYQTGTQVLETETVSSGSLTIEFPFEAEWQWWLEVSEYKDGTEINEAKVITEAYTLKFDQTPPTGSITVKSADGGRICTETEPANQSGILLTDLQITDLFGVEKITLWNGTAITPPDGAINYAINEIPSAGIPWELPDLDGLHQINMLIEDNAGNTTLVAAAVALDRVAPGVPQNITHSYTNGVMTFKWSPGEPSADISQYRGTYILPDGIEQPFSVTPAETGEGQYQIAVGLGANQPVIIKVCSVDRATNQSEMIPYTGCTPAEPGKLQFLGTDYDTIGNKHYQSWKLVEPGIAETQKLEYGQTVGDEFVPTGEITLGVDGVFTHNATGLNPEDKLQPHAIYTYRLAAYNKAGDRTYSQVFTQEVENLPPVKPEITEFAPSGYASGKVIFDYPEAKDYDNDAVTPNVKWAEGTNPTPGAYQNATWDQELKKYSIDLNPVKHGTTFCWYLEAKDSYGAVTTSDIVHFTLDVNNPELTVEKPKSLYTNLKELKVSVKDDLSGIKALVYKAGNLEPQTVALTPGTGGEMTGIIQLIEGSYNLKVTVQDQAGNNVSEDVNNLWVDHTLPILDQSSIVIELGVKDGVFLTSGKIPVSWKANDSGSGIAGIRYWILGSGEEPSQGIYISLSSGLTDYAHQLELGTDKSNGQTYNLEIAVIDKAGNSSDTYRLSQGFLLDKTPPGAELSLTGLYPNGSSLYLTNLENLQALLTIREEESGATERFNLIESVNKTPITTWDKWENVKQSILTPGEKYRVAARATNGVGLETEVLSEEFTFDNSEPIITNLTGPDQALTTGESFILNVTADEYETSIVKYRIAIGAELGATQFTALIPGNQNGWYEFNTNSLQPQLRMEVPEIADGVYQITLEAVNACGLTARFSEDRTLTVSNNQERIVVSDQGPYTMFADRLTGWWKYNGLRTVSSYQFRVLDQDNQVIRDWENTTETILTVTQLQLENGKTYHFEVQAILQGNEVSTSGFSPGVTVDNTAPAITELKAPLYAAPNDFGFDWAGSDDYSGISRVLAAVGSDYNQTDITKGWVEVTGNSVKLSRDINGEPLVFDLDNTKRYYLTLRIVNGAGLTAEKAAPAIVVDNTPPPTPAVCDQGGFINTKPEQPLEAHWFWSESDPESGSSYQWTILKYGDKVTPLTEWYDGEDSKRVSLTMDQFQREHGATYYLAVKATNGAGLSSIGYSDGIMADATAPYLLKVKVLDATNQSGDEEINYVTDSNKALRLWIDSYDPDSNISSYLYAWNIPEEVDQTERSTSTAEPISITNPDLVEGAINIFLGETVNQADITSPSGYSTGIVVDSEAPVIKNLRGGISGDSLLFDWEVETSASPMVRYEYAFVNEAKVNSIAAGDWKTAEDKSLDRRLILDATAYQDGRYCLVVRGYNAAGTYSRNDGEHQEWGISNVITLDRTAPEITTAVFPKYADESIKFSVSAMDQGSGIDGYQYTLGTAANPFQFSGGWIDLNNQASTVNIEIPTDSNVIPHNTGVYTMVRVRDKVGLWSTPKVSGKIVIDHTKPETPVITYGRYTTNKLLLTGIEYQAVEPESGLVNYRLGLITESGGAWLVTKEEQVQLTPDGKPVKLNLAIDALGLTEAVTYQLAIQVQNGTGDWSEIGYSGLITVDSIKPVLTFSQAGQMMVINHPPLNVEYTLSEDSQVKITITGADGSAKEETIAGVTGVNQYIFNERKPQLYTVTATPTDKAGNVGDGIEISKQTIRVNAPPVVNLAGQFKATLGRPLTLKADVTDPDGIEGDSFTYEWLPGDVSAALYGATPEYKYTTLGDYTLTLTVTDKDGGKTTVTSIVMVGNTTSGELCVDETWSGIHRIYGDVIIPTNLTLTIQPGTEIIIDGIPGETGFNNALIVRGTLNIGAGTSFTSVTGTQGGWKGILVEGEATLEGVTIGHAERGVAALDGSEVTLTGCTFENNLAGVHAYGSNPKISSCIFRYNVYGIKEDEGGRPTVKDCRFTGNGVDYYHLELTEISMEQLNGIPGNSGNQEGN